MLAPDLRDAIMARLLKIPVVSTPDLEIPALARGYCEAKAPRKVTYDGLFKSFHGGLLISRPASNSCNGPIDKTL